MGASSKGRGKFNAQKSEAIGWARWSWNPATGCRAGCPYCYARDLTEKHGRSFEPTFHAERLSMSTNTPLPTDEDPGSRRVFTCSMGELFGDWVSEAWIQAVLNVVAEHPEWTFLFLTKNPKRYLEFDFPPNTWLGTTADTQKRMDAALDVFDHLEATVEFLSCEPLTEQPLRIRAGAAVPG